MAYVLDDFQLERICDRSPDCGCNCMKCEAFAANQRFHNGDHEDDDDDDDYQAYGNITIDLLYHLGHRTHLQAMVKIKKEVICLCKKT